MNPSSPVTSILGMRQAFSAPVETAGVLPAAIKPDIGDRFGLGSGDGDLPNSNIGGLNPEQVAGMKDTNLSDLKGVGIPTIAGAALGALSPAPGGAAAGAWAGAKAGLLGKAVNKYVVNPITKYAQQAMHGGQYSVPGTVTQEEIEANFPGPMSAPIGEVKDSGWFSGEEEGEDESGQDPAGGTGGGMAGMT